MVDARTCSLGPGVSRNDEDRPDWPSRPAADDDEDDTITPRNGLTDPRQALPILLPSAVPFLDASVSTTPSSSATLSPTTSTTSPQTPSRPPPLVPAHHRCITLFLVLPPHTFSRSITFVHLTSPRPGTPLTTPRSPPIPLHTSISGVIPQQQHRRARSQPITTVPILLPLPLSIPLPSSHTNNQRPTRL